MSSVRRFYCSIYRYKASGETRRLKQARTYQVSRIERECHAFVFQLTLTHMEAQNSRTNASVMRAYARSVQTCHRPLASVLKRYYRHLLFTCMYPRVAPHAEVGGVNKASCYCLDLRTKNCAQGDRAFGFLTRPTHFRVLLPREAYGTHIISRLSFHDPWHLCTSRPGVGACSRTQTPGEDNILRTKASPEGGGGDAMSCDTGR